MHEAPGQATTDPLGDVGRAKHGGEGEIAPGQRLPHAHDVGHHARGFGGPHRAGAAEPRGDLVEDHQGPTLPGKFGQHLHHSGVVEGHPAGALQDGFEDHRGDLVRVCGIQGARICFPHNEIRVRGIGSRWVWGEEVLGQDAAPE